MRLCGDDLPVRCSVCLQPPAAFDPKPEYVDFNAQFDGPMVDSGEPGVPSVYIEKIVICEHCLREAGDLLGLGDVTALRQHVARQDAFLDELQEAEKHHVRSISDLERTVAHLIDHPIRRPMARPRFKGPDSHKKEINRLNRERRRETADA